MFVPLTTLLVVPGDGALRVVLLAVGLTTRLLPLRLLLPLPARLPAPSSSPRPVRLAGVRRWLAVVFALHGFAGVVVSVDLVWHRVECGDSLAGAAAVAGLAGAAQVPGRLPGVRAGPPADRPSCRCCWGVQATALLGMALGTGAAGTVAVLLFGAANGMMTLERASVLVGWYGRDGFGAHNGRITAVSVSKAAAPSSSSCSTRRSYGAVFAALAVVVAMGTGCSVWAGRARRAEGPLPQ